MGINDNILDNIMQDVGKEKSDISGGKVTITNPNKMQKLSKKPKKEWDTPIGLYLEKAEKDDFQTLCRFNKTAATNIARELILKYLKTNKEILIKLKDLDSIR